MSCSTEVALAQSKRLKGLSFFPRDIEPQNEIASAIQSTAVNDSDAKRIVSAWLSEESRAPTPAEIRGLRAPRSERAECECAGGWVQAPDIGPDWVKRCPICFPSNGVSR